MVGRDARARKSWLLLAFMGRTRSPRPSSVRIALAGGCQALCPEGPSWLRSGRASPGSAPGWSWGLLSGSWPQWGWDSAGPQVGDQGEGGQPAGDPVFADLPSSSRGRASRTMSWDLLPTSCSLLGPGGSGGVWAWRIVLVDPTAKEPAMDANPSISQSSGSLTCPGATCEGSTEPVCAQWFWQRSRGHPLPMKQSQCGLLLEEPRSLRYQPGPQGLPQHRWARRAFWPRALRQMTGSSRSRS